MTRPHETDDDDDAIESVGDISTASLQVILHAAIASARTQRIPLYLMGAVFDALADRVRQLVALHMVAHEGRSIEDAIDYLDKRRH